MSSITRRQFLAGAVALSLSGARSLRAAAESLKAGPRWVLLGTGTGGGIYRARWNSTNGELSDITLAAPTKRPTFLARHPLLPVLYAANERNQGDGLLSAFTFDAFSGELHALNQVSTGGNGPCYVSTDHRGHSAFAANYGGGSLAAFSLASDGSLLRSADALDCNGDAACGALGPVTARQEAAHLHCAVVSPDNNFVLACNLGEDAIELLPIAPDAKPGHILGAPELVPARAGSGPRHVAFHPNGHWLYCVHELDATLDLYDWSVAHGLAAATLRPGSVVSTLEPGTSLTGNTGCELQISADGRFLYTCTRGVDTLSVYSIHATTGLLTLLQRLSCGGSVPRFFALDPSESWLLCCNQTAPGSVTVFARDHRTGRLNPQHQSFAAETPMCAVWI